MTPAPESIAISGASGFVGQNLLRELCARGLQRDRRAARNFAEAAAAQEVRRIIYLGGLGRSGLSVHLASRAEVGEILQSTGIPVTITSHCVFEPPRSSC